METWEQLSKQNLIAAKELLGRDYCRSCISRAYYAAYSGITARLAPIIKPHEFNHGGNNPSHSQLKGMLKRLGLPKHESKTVGQLLNGLKLAREESDYMPQATIDRTTAKDSIRDAGQILRYLGITP